MTRAVTALLKAGADHLARSAGRLAAGARYARADSPHASRAQREARAASLELENGSLKRLAAASAETRDKLAKTERLLAAAVAERDASRADAAAARRDVADALVAACVEINQCDGCTDNSSLSHFSAITRPSWLCR